MSDYNVVSDSFSTDLGLSKMTLAGWRTASGQDAHSVVATASQLFVNPAGGDYHLKAGSPAIDRGSQSLPGVATPAPSDDMTGAPSPGTRGRTSTARARRRRTRRRPSCRRSPPAT